MQRVLSSELSQFVGQEVRVQGWLHNVRDMGEVNFVVVRDRHGLAQAVLGPTDLDPLRSVSVESIVQLCGTVVEAPPAPGGFELHRVSADVLEPAAEPPPFELNKKTMAASLPVFLEHAVVGHRHINQRAILKLASGIMQGFRHTLNLHDFTEIQTPKLVGSSTEGGAEVYRVEHFGQEAYLAQSPQFYKQIMVGVFERVFEVGPVFRAEKHATTRHINEYVSMDVEFGFIEDHFDVMAMAETVITGILDYLGAYYQREISLLKLEMPVYPKPFPHIHFSDAQQMLAEKFGLTDAIGAKDLTPEHERTLGRWAQAEHGSDFLFVVGYPMSKRPFYTHPDTERPEFSNSFDLLFRGTELITGGQRLHRYEDYMAAAQQGGYDIDNFAAYFETFKHGMPKHGGFAIGLERFVMQLLKLDNIRQATLFPRDINRLTP